MLGEQSICWIARYGTQNRQTWRSNMTLPAVFLLSVTSVSLFVNAAPTERPSDDKKDSRQTFHNDPGREVMQKCVFDFYASISNVLDEAESKSLPIDGVVDEFRELLNRLVEKSSFNYKPNSTWLALTRDNGTRDISNSHTKLIFIAQNFVNIIAQDIRKEKGNVSLKQKDSLRKLCSSLNSSRNVFICCIHDPYLQQRQCQKESTRAAYDGCEMCDVCTGCR